MPGKKPSSSQLSRTMPAWVWLALGILIGLVIAMMARTGDRHADSDQTGTTVESKRDTDTKPSTQRSFDFYTLLPELEVVIPADVEEKRKKHVRAKPVGGYLLQVGSFQQFDEANSLKVHLAKLDVTAHIQSVNVDGSTWYRVRIGPVDSRETLEELREHLRKNGIDAMLMQAKQ